ncbi:hypothetical protein PIB30_005437 [Stylosanthes scabra]|uniref:Uncharacterized protein n=1 Tax=Stylosanthes scabra TaxID=79078 RepID=A0ABU6Y214_9FABA|nr:hypothetical protein [Stylosanthes scabra]
MLRRIRSPKVPNSQTPSQPPNPKPVTEPPPTTSFFSLAAVAASRPSPYASPPAVLLRLPSLSLCVVPLLSRHCHFRVSTVHHRQLSGFKNRPASSVAEPTVTDPTVAEPTVGIDGENLDQRYPNLHLDSGDSTVGTISKNGRKKHVKHPPISAPPMCLYCSKIAMLKWIIHSRCQFRRIQEVHLPPWKTLNESTNC